MKMKAACPCGATLEGESSHYINGGGAPDSQGRVFLIQVNFDKWHELHKDHKASDIKEFFHGR